MAVIDHEFEKIHKLVQPASDLAASFTTYSNALYILACLNARGKPIKDNLHSFINGDLSAIRNTNIELANTSSFAALSSLLYEARSILRLFRIVPMLARLRDIIKTSHLHKDRCQWWMEFVESSLFTAYQAIENFAVLVDYKIVPKWISSRMKDSDPTAIYTLAYRVWMLALSCRIVNGLRTFSAWLKQHTAEPNKAELHKVDQHSSSHLLLLAWLPVGWTLSGWTEYELPGLHMVLHYFGDGFSEAKSHVHVWNKIEVKKN